MIKKLLIITVMFISTSAWAETITLECEYTYEKPKEHPRYPEGIKKHSITYTFDPELPNGETSSGTEVKVNVFPNTYKLTWQASSPPGTNRFFVWSNDFTADISRVDLSYTYTNVSNKADLVTGKNIRSVESNDNGKCKFIESAKNLF